MRKGCARNQRVESDTIAAMSNHTILVISGSLRAASFNTALGRAAVRLSRESATLASPDLIRSLPAYDEDMDGEPVQAAVAAMRTAIAEAAGVRVITPEYNYGLPGGLKNLIDWASRPFGKHCLVGKPVAVAGSSPSGRGGKAAVEYLRLVLPAIGANLVGVEVLVPGVQGQVDVSTDVISPEATVHLEALLADLRSAIDSPTPAAS